MVCSSYSRREADILWRSFVGVTFLFCSLILYRFIDSDNVQCLSKSDCSKSLKHTAEKFQSENCNTVCTTRDCMDISNFMLSSINQTADPCSDFYNFACGNFVDKYGIQDNYSIFPHGVGDELHNNLKDFIETSDEPDGTLMHKIKIIYDSCVNKGSSEINVTHDILSFLGNVGLHNWPYLSSDFSFVNQELPELLGKLNAYNEAVFFMFRTSYFDNRREKKLTEEKLSDLLKLITGVQNIGDRIKLQITPVWGHINRDLIKVEKILKKILRNLGLKQETIKTIWKDFDTIDEHMDKLKENYSFGSGHETIQCRNETEEYKIMFCKTLDSVVRNGELAPRVYKNQMDVETPDLHFLENVFGLIKNFSDRAIANHIALNVILNNLNHMNFFIRKAELLNSEEDYSYTRYSEKWRYCVVWIAEKLRYALASEYVDKMFPNEAEEEVNYMMEEIINTTIKFIHTQEGIDESSKIQAAATISSLMNTFSKNAKLLKYKWKVNFIHKMFIPTPTSFIQNVFQFNKFSFTSQLLNEDIIFHFEQFEPFWINAFGGYSIHIPYGILTPPVFKYGYPKILNIATLGHIFAHEIGHSFDYIMEKMFNDTWTVFPETSQCLTEQYSNFELKDIKKYVRGNQTLSENFADTLGLEVVEKVSEKYIMEMTKNGFSLPGMSYSPKELFYIFYAQLWCKHESPESLLHVYETDTHAPTDFRIIGTLQNSPRFSRVFNCFKTSYMNPQKKCRVFG